MHARREDAMNSRALQGAIVAMLFLCPSIVGAAEAVSFAMWVGGGRYQNEAFNREFEAQGLEGVHGGTEFGGSIRVPFAQRWSIDLEVARLQGNAKTPPRFEVAAPVSVSFLRTRVTALPVQLGYSVLASRSGHVSVLAGAGPMVAHWEVEGTSYAPRSESVTRIYAQAALEGGLRMTPGIELTLRAVGRLAQANHVTQEGSSNELVTDMSGVGVALGMRLIPAR